MAHRYAVRRMEDSSHVYCIATSNNKDQILKIGLSDKEQED